MTDLSTTTPQKDLHALYAAQGLVYYSPVEELLNVITHAAGILFGLIGMVFMLLIADSPADCAVAVLSSLGFMILFLSSSAYHGVSRISAKRILRRIDYSAINFLVISCGTGACLLYESPIGYAMYALSWAVTITVIFLCLKFFGKTRPLAIASVVMISVFMGIAFFSNLDRIPAISIDFYIAGLVLVLIGAVLFGIKKKFVHALFHLFVLFGPICFFMSNYYQLA